VKSFTSPSRSFGKLNADSVAALLAAATDITIVVDNAGIIRDCAIQPDALAHELTGVDSWIGRPFIDTVTPESRTKVEALLREAGANKPSSWRQVNYASTQGPNLPILYSAIPLGSSSRTIIVGRDQRHTAVLQQRLMEAQLSMEQDYEKLRQAETRYRLLFERSTEAVLIVEAATQKVLDANPMARQLFGDAEKRLLKSVFSDTFAKESAPAIEALLAGVRTSGRPDEARAQLADQERDVTVSVTLFRQENASLLLIRVTPVVADAEATAGSKLKAKLLKLVESAPDGFVVTSADGKILTANAAFLDMAHLATESQARGELLERWLGRPGVDLDVLIANLRQRGSVRLFGTILRADHGSSTDVEVSAVAVTNGGQPYYGFAIRNVGRRFAAATRSGRELPRSVEALMEHVGRVSLKKLVRETTDVIERLYIEAALELTGDNRASAAEILGLSRQSLYVKLRRYGIAAPT
jgi:transcriptional regulator PpsR